MISHAVRSSAILLVAALALGCSSSSDRWTANRPQTFPVKGTVTYNGQAVEGAIVVFNCVEENKSAFAQTDAQGRFQLTTFEEGDGAVAGIHQVQISKIKTEEAVNVNPEATVVPPKETHLLPKKYSTFATSGLTAEVSAEGVNQMEFALVD